MFVIRMGNDSHRFRKEKEKEKENKIFSKEIKEPKKIYSEFFDNNNNNNNNNIFYLSSHKFYKNDEIDENSTVICAINKELEGQQWKFITNYEGIYEIKFNLDDYKMKNWNVSITDDENIILSNDDTYKKTAFILIEKEDENNSNNFYIQDALTGKFLGIDREKKRDKISYFLNLTKEKEFVWKIKNVD